MRVSTSQYPVIVILLLVALPVFAQDTKSKEWKNPLTHKGYLNSPLVEVTPFVFKGRLYRLDNWQKQWELENPQDGSHTAEDEVRIRDMASERIISVPLVGHGLGMALVHEDRIYVFAGDWGEGEKWNITEISMTSSDDLITWTKPQVVLKAESHEKFFNVSVSHAETGFVMLVESNDPAWPTFTFKYFRSDDLLHWKKVPDALYGVDKYVGGPALYHEGPYFYTLYLQALGKGHYETRMARSVDLVSWQDAPDDRPFATYITGNPVHAHRPDDIRETNASDVELCAWKDKTLVYYTGGDQHFSGDLQWATYNGTPRELLEAFFDSP
jgi:alpha-L-fucosidase